MPKANLLIDRSTVTSIIYFPFIVILQYGFMLYMTTCYIYMRSEDNVYIYFVVSFFRMYTMTVYTCTEILKNIFIIYLWLDGCKFFPITCDHWRNMLWPWLLGEEGVGLFGKNVFSVFCLKHSHKATFAEKKNLAKSLYR